MTHDAAMTSLIRYALAGTGSRLPPDPFRRVNLQNISIAARRFSNPSRGARKESLHYAVGTAAAYNLYVRHCAQFLDGCLRASNSTIAERLHIGLQQCFHVPPSPSTTFRWRS